MPDPVFEAEHDDVIGRAFDRRLASRLWASARAHHRLVWSSIALFPLVTLVELAQPYLIKIAIDDYILTADWAGLAVVAVLYAASLGALYALRMVEAYLMALTGQQVIHDLRATLFAHLLKLEAGFFDRTPVGRLMTRVLSDVEAVSEAFTSGIFAIVADVVTLVGVVAIMLWMDWRLALVTYAIVPVLFGVAGYLRIRARDAYREVRRRLARLNAFLQESIQGMSVIQLFGREEHERRQFERLNQDYRRAQFTLPPVRGLALRHGGGAGLAGAGAPALVRRRRDPRRRAHVRRARGVHPVHQPLLPAHPGPRREVHGDAGGDGVGRAHLRPARSRAPDRIATCAARRAGDRPGASRLRERVVRVHGRAMGGGRLQLRHRAGRARRAGRHHRARASRPACDC